MRDIHGPDPEFVERLWARMELEAFGPVRLEVGATPADGGGALRRRAFVLAAAASVTALLVLLTGSLQTDRRAVDELDVAKMLPSAGPTPEPDGGVDRSDVERPPGVPVPVPAAGAPASAQPTAAPAPAPAADPGSARRRQQRPAVAPARQSAPPGAHPVLDQLLFGYDTPEDDDYELAMISLDDPAQVVVLTENDGAHDFQANWAPDGERIVFGSRYRNGHDHIQLYVRETNGTERRLTQHGCDATATICGDTHPDWSPTGDLVAFTRGGAYPGCQPSLGECGTIMLVPAAGGTPVALTSGWRASWSPDGRQLVFATARDDVSRASCDDYFTGCFGDLHVINRDGTGLRPLGVKGDNPRWSPDGRFITYTGRVEPGRAQQVRIIAATGAGGPRDVTTTGHFFPAWSPDGRSLVTLRYSGGAYDLWLTDVATGESVQLTRTPAIESLPVFRPRQR